MVMGFILIIIGALLILLNIKAIKKADNSFSSILKREESTVNRDYDVEIISIRKDLAESIFDIQKEMEEIKASVLDITNKENTINYLESIEEKIEKDDIITNDIKVEDKNIISEINFAYKPEKINKVDEVKRLVQDGFTDEEICTKMFIGKGEVLLIKGLFKS
ncbi:hypothetical protein H7E67_12480 [Clostridium gasigenes]|uniref:Uncharacterized protein n=2 Tax=Clostridium gasigenes TaxID=94869 RepID=A0A7X0SE53_9CLOT|nr:hypothetical protein [Clostridium gasigenes]MBB6714637.1 hypothetical protein [Clostridium gasigenes]